MEATSKSSGYFTSFDGTQIYYETRGEGPAIIFVYGLACLMNHWHFQVDYFSQHFQVITFDIRGHHKSETPKDMAQLSISAVAKDMQFLLEHLKLNSAVLVGHSFGVPSVLQFCCDSASRVSSLVLINGFSKNPIRGMYGVNLIETLFLLLKENYSTYPDLWNKLWNLSVNNPISMWMSGLLGGFNLRVAQFKDVEIYARGVSQIPLINFLTLYEDMIRFDKTDSLKSIEKKTLIISGENDHITPLSFQKELHENIKGSELSIIPYGSHCTQLDFPDYVNLKIEHFLTGPH